MSDNNLPSCRLVNASAQPVDTVLVLVSREVAMRSVKLGRPATLVREEPRHQQRMYVLSQPLQPGDSMTMSFHTAFERRGFPNAGVPTDVVANGAYFDHGWLPMIGYQSSRELTSDKTRKRHGLGPRAGAPSARDSAEFHARRFDIRGAERVHMNVVVGTADDQTAVTSGNLVREWREDGRRYFHYRTDVPIANGAPYLSARYEVREDRWKDVPLRIYYHETHTFNLDRIMNSMKSSLEYYSTAFGPYPYSELRVVEFPRPVRAVARSAFRGAFREGASRRHRACPWLGGRIRGARCAPS